MKPNPDDFQADLAEAVPDSADLPDSPGALWKDMAMVLLLLVYSGNPAPERMFSIEIQMSGLAVLLGRRVMRRSRSLVSRDFIAIAMLFAGILCIQCISFRFYPVVTIAGFIIRLFIGYTVVVLVDDFPRVYLRVMYTLAILSFIFYFPYVFLHVVGVSVESTLSSFASLLNTMSFTRRPLLLHTFDGHFSYRNFGMFWEPGAFQGYLNLGMIFLALVKHRLDPKLYRRYFWVFIIAILTTMSTTGYVTMVLVILMQYDWHAEDSRTMNYRILFGVYIVLPLLAVGSWFAYSKLPFLGNKIETQLNALERRQGRWHRGRFGSLIFDWEYIKEKPLTGWGLHSKTRYSLHPWMASSEGMGNGFSDFTAKFGIAGFLIWLVAVLRSFQRLGPSSSLQICMIGMTLLLLLQGECFLAYPLFLGLAFVGVIEEDLAIDEPEVWDMETGSFMPYQLKEGR